MSADLRDFERLAAALRPWLDTLVVVGGWAHRLHFEHRLAGKPGFQPVRTRDADVAFASNARLGGNIAQALSDAGFAEDLSSEETPPIAQYVLGGMVHPWTFTIGGASPTLKEPVALRVANPAAFIAQKLLIHGTRKANKQAQDILYIHDTLQLFGAQWPLIAELWREHVRPTLSANQRAAVRDAQGRAFDQVSDAIRSAARIPVDRTLRPEEIRAVCASGLSATLPDD